MSIMPETTESMRKAVALSYQSLGHAPKVVATGNGIIAEQIIELAKQSGVYVHESEEMVALLMNVKLDQEIPANLYRVVAEILAWLYRIEKAKLPNQS